MGELPSWVVYPDFERVRWLNKALEEIFPYLQRGITKKVVAVVDPILDRVKPRLLGSLRIMVSFVYFHWRTHARVVLL